MSVDLEIEGEEPAPPPPKRRPQQRTLPPAETAPEVYTTEHYLFSCCLMEREYWRGMAHLPPAAFRAPELAAGWNALRNGVDPADPVAMAKASRLSFSRFSTLLGIAGLGGGYTGWLREFEHDWQGRAFRALLAEMSTAADPDPLVWSKRLQDIALQPLETQKARPITAYAIPPENDDSILLGDRYLNRGDAMVISGTSGAGKSSMTRQMMVCWALGRDFHGIKPARPVRSIEIQAEDSEGDVGEVMLSLKHGLRLTDAEMQSVAERVMVVTERVRRGQSFIDELRRLVAKHKPDLVWINPLQAFIEGDVTDSRDLGDFLRAGLNSLNEPPTFAYAVVHHTTKPATGKDKAERLWHEVMYDMAGGAEIINWARAIISLRPGEEAGQFNMVLAKRGTRAGVVRKVEQGAGTRDEIVTTVPVKWSDEMIEIPGRQKRMRALFWLPREPDTPKEQSDAPKSGRPRKHEFSTYRDAFPKDPTKALSTNALHRAMGEYGSVSKPSFFDLLNGAIEDGLVTRVMVNGQPRYHLAVIK